MANDVHSDDEGMLAGEPAVRDAVGAAQPAAPPSDEELARLPRNDLGNARRLIARFGHDLIYSEKEGWVIWQGTHWQPDARNLQARQLAHKVADGIRDEAAALALMGDAKLIDGLLKFAAGSGNSNRIGNMLKEAEPYRRRAPSDFDADSMLFNVENGTLELGDVVRFREHRRNDLITRIAGAAYDPNADCPKFRAFLERIQPNPETRTFLQRYLGYALTGSIGAQILLLFYGRGANGKSALLNIVRGVSGSYAMVLAFESLAHDVRRRGSEATPDLVRLHGARLVTASEPEVGTRLSEGMVKAQTGGEPMVVRPLYGDTYEFQPTHKLILSCNNRPRVAAQDEGTWRRMVMVPFEVTIPENERDARIAETILGEEASGILNYLLDGFRLWHENGLAIPEHVRAATAAYRSDMDPIGDFLDGCVVRERGATVRAARLHLAYTVWCTHNGREAISLNKFGRLMTERGYQRHTSGYVNYVDIRLIEGAAGTEDPDDYGSID